VILTGTPSGVGLGMSPQRYLRPGEVVTTVVEGVGEMRHGCRLSPQPFDAAALVG